MAVGEPRLSVALGAVLCGGASRRMGADKALVPVEGVPMALRVATALREAGCEPVVAIGGDRPALEALGLPVVDDEFPGEGPLGGVITALGVAAGADVVAIACDLPHVRAATVRSLLDALQPPLQVAIAGAPALQPVCAAWAAVGTAHLRSLFLNGERRITTALRAMSVVSVLVPAQDLANVNTPEDLPQ